MYPLTLGLSRTRLSLQIFRVVGNFKDYQFYIGESMAPEGMVVLLNYREDGVTPYCVFWKDGLKEVKL